jgi:putative addiction module component (TIGR02574 family)
LTPPFAEWYKGKLARGGFEPANEEAWAAEVERRIEELDSGKVKSMPAEEVFAELRQRYGRVS